MILRKLVGLELFMKIPSIKKQIPMIKDLGFRSKRRFQVSGVRFQERTRDNIYCLNIENLSLSSVMRVKKTDGTCFYV